MKDWNAKQSRKSIAAEFFHFCRRFFRHLHATDLNFASSWDSSVNFIKEPKFWEDLGCETHSQRDNPCIQRNGPPHRVRRSIEQLGPCTWRWVALQAWRPPGDSKQRASRRAYKNSSAFHLVSAAVDICGWDYCCCCCSWDWKLGRLWARQCTKWNWVLGSGTASDSCQGRWRFRWVAEHSVRSWSCKWLWAHYHSTPSPCFSDLGAHTASSPEISLQVGKEISLHQYATVKWDRLIW